MGRRVASGLPAHGDGVKEHWSQSAFANTGLDLHLEQTQLAVFIADFERPSHEGEMGSCGTTVSGKVANCTPIDGSAGTASPAGDQLQPRP
jgi:hypothetical protein